MSASELLRWGKNTEKSIAVNKKIDIL